jgi:putative SOS response-associated peptidase YedK
VATKPKAAAKTDPDVGKAPTSTRSLWKGAISFGLVHVPIALYSATDESDLNFKMIDKRTMDPVGYKRINKKSGKEVANTDIVKGIEWENGQFVLLTPEEIAAAYPKPTKAAAESQRIATDKIAQGHTALKDVSRTRAATARRPRIPRPVCARAGDGKRPPAGKPASYDEKYPGTYNARKDNLAGFWRGKSGMTHGVMVEEVFYENVSTANGNVVLEFRPEPAVPMLVACLWSWWMAPGQADLLSFAAITDSPLEIAEARHDRCLVPVKPESLDHWLQPNAARLGEQMGILEDPLRPYYESRLAA